MSSIAYNKSLDLLNKVSSKNGFLASAENTSNYNRVWARDGVICGLAALASGDEKLISTFSKTLETLASKQHEMGTIPSNVLIDENNIEVSYGGLAGRVDAVTWFIIGVCQYAIYKNDIAFFNKYKAQIDKAIYLLNAWEFNNNHLIYVPLSGNWADEYITDGYVLYDQLLRVWALKSYNFFENNSQISSKIECITKQVEVNFFPNNSANVVHKKAYDELKFDKYLPCSFSPSGYKNQYDAFANALVLILNIGTAKAHKNIVEYTNTLIESTKLKLAPAFWPPIFENNEYWSLLKDNCKFEFRNYAYEFHNAGSWPMVNGFLVLGYLQNNEVEKASALLNSIEKANEKANYGFFENFNTETLKPNGVSECAWSAAANVLAYKSINSNFKLFT